MKNRTVTITVSASFDDVFSYLADPKTLPVWAPSFSSEIQRKDGLWEVVTPQGGRLLLAIESERSSGSIDMLAGPTLETMESFPIRIYRADSGETAASFTMFKSQRPEYSDVEFEAHFRVLVQEAEALLQRFGGGEISRGLPQASGLCPGIVTDKMEETKSFYVDFLGFKPTFDSPFYIHLQRDDGSVQFALMKASDEEAHEEFRRPMQGSGIWLNLTVSDVDEEYRRLIDSGASIREEPKDQPWGDRTCVVVDPNGVLIYLSQPKGKMDESLLAFAVNEENSQVGSSL